MKYCAWRRGRFIQRYTGSSRRGGSGSEWGTSENNRRAKYYRLTAVGRKQLAKEQENWDRLTRAVAKVLRFA